jgi:hypothetical protein
MKKARRRRRKNAPFFLTSRSNTACILKRLQVLEVCFSSNEKEKEKRTTPTDPGAELPAP